MKMLEKVRSGYKHTEVGEIPEDWDCAELDDFISFISYGFTNPMPTTQNGPYMVTAADVSEGRIDFSTARRTSIEAFETLLTPKSKPRRDDILLTKDGALGRVALVGDETICINQSVAILRPNSRVDPEFLSLLLQAEQYQKRMIEDAGGSTIKHIYITIVNRMPIAVPRSKHEQRTIAKVLSDADARIAALEALIAKKRDLKQAAMQQLLTGNARLPGFSSAWNTVRLGDHVNFLKNGTLSRADLTTDGSISYLHYGDIHSARSPRLDPIQTELPKAPPIYVKNLDRLVGGDLVFVDASEDLDGVGKSVELVDTNGCEVVSGLHTIAARFDKSVLADGFKAYLQFIPSFSGHLRSLAAGTKVLATNRKHISSAEIKLPPPPEQSAIAEILSDMDEEIAALEAEAEKAHAIKQGMMQTLLTGKVRLV